jgi:PAS domain S-box-containing protein
MTEMPKVHAVVEGDPETFDKREESFRKLTAAAFEGIGVSEGGKVVVVNDQLARFWGYTREELIGFDVLQMVAPESRAQAAAAIRAGREEPYELVALRKDGTTFQAEVRAKMVLWGGRLVRLTGVRDITERKNAERRLRRSEELFRAIVQDQTEMIVRSTPEGVRTFVNQAYCRFFERPYEELVGTSFYLEVPEEDREAIRAKIRRLTPEQPTAVDVHRSIRKDETICWQEWMDRGIFDAEGKLTGVQSVGRDITERKLAEEQRQRQAEFDGVLTHVLARFASCTANELDEAVRGGLQAISTFFGADEAFVAVVSPDGKAWSAAHDWCAPHVKSRRELYQNVPWGAFPWSESKILAGETVRINQLPDFPPEAQADRKTNEAEGVLSVLSVPIRGAAGRVTGSVGLRSHAKPVAWSDVGIARFQIVGNAIASLLERKRAEQTLREVSLRLHRAHEEEGRRIARELHDSTAQELAAVKMNLEMLEDFTKEPKSKTARLLQDSVNLVERCSQEVRTFAYLLHPPLLDQIGLAGALRSYVEGFSKRSGIKVSVQVNGDVTRQAPEVELTLFRMVQEGLGNIHRHSGSKRTRVQLSAREDAIVLEIADTGKGIPKQIVKDLEQGLTSGGVGLAAMRERLRAVGGTLTIENTEPGTRLRASVPSAKGAE